MTLSWGWGYGRESRLRRRDLRFRDQVFAARVVDLLLRDEPWTLLIRRGQPLRREVRHLVRGFGALQLVARTSHVGLGAAHAGIGAEQVVPSRHFEGGEQLPLLYAITRVDVDLADVARHLGHDVDLLVRLELGGDDDAVRKIFMAYLGDRYVGDVGDIAGVSLLTGAGDGEQRAKAEEDRGPPHFPMVGEEGAQKYTAIRVFLGANGVVPPAGTSPAVPGGNCGQSGVMRDVGQLGKLRPMANRPRPQWDDKQRR